MKIIKNIIAILTAIFLIALIDGAIYEYIFIGG